jgi:hypothetical protein
VSSSCWCGLAARSRAGAGASGAARNTSSNDR